jgi:hypothetical protein
MDLFGQKKIDATTATDATSTISSVAVYAFPAIADSDAVTSPTTQPDAFDDIIEQKTNALSLLSFVEVVGLEINEDGRSCEQHLCCGRSVFQNDKLICSWHVEPTEDEDLDEVVKVHKIGTDGFVTCHVGYLPKRMFVKYGGAKKFDLMYLRVTDDLRVSENKHERSRSKRYYGVVNCAIIRNNPRYVGKNPFEGDPCDVSVAPVVESNPDITTSGKPTTTKTESSDGRSIIRKKKRKRNNKND